MSFSLRVQRKERKERTPCVKSFSSFTAYSSGSAELVSLKHAALLFRKILAHSELFKRGIEICKHRDLKFAKVY